MPGEHEADRAAHDREVRAAQLDQLTEQNANGIAGWILAALICALALAPVASRTTLVAWVAAGLGVQLARAALALRHRRARARTDAATSTRGRGR